jgi:enoyl-CoA hydratase
MTAPKFDHLLFETDSAGISLLTVNRPGKLNALNKNVLEELDKAIAFAERNDDVQALIITGAGEKAFIAGADINELSSMDRKSGEEASSRGQQVFGRIEHCRKPVIAVINGYALGGGAELAMACHIRIAAENALIGLPEVSLGLIPGYGGTQRLPHLVGKSKAMEIILTGQPVRAEEAESIGLVNHVKPSGEAIDYAKELASKIIKNGPLALSMAIKAVNAAYPNHGFAKEASLFGQLCETEDFKEGTHAFLEKRKPVFKGQ